MIMGHTDAQKISPGTAQRHPTNVHLSAHRAISVRSALGSMGVPSDKMFVAGWGEFRPVAANGPKGECAANRRVEIYLTHATTASMGDTTEPATTPSKPTKASTANEKPPTRQPDLTK
jgi:chemotaxis protein MotB